MLPTEKGLIDAIEKISSSVVSISIVRLFRQRFFEVIPVQGMGSGVIIDKNGYILTNYHIIEGAEHVEVTLSDGKKLKGQIVGADNSSDIAVIKVDKDGLISAKLSDSGILKVGQMVVAIGNPFGFLLNGPTVTTGVVSALNRHLHLDGRMYEDMIQTDAAINPGNSGGPLINSSGEVIGINTAIIPFAQGIGFAISINKAKDIAEQLIEHGRVYKPWIGISGVTATESIARYFDLPAQKGVVVVDVIDSGPAEEAGIRSGDIITGIGNKELKSMEDLLRELEKHKVGDSIEIDIIRKNQRAKINLKLEEAP